MRNCLNIQCYFSPFVTTSPFAAIGCVFLDFASGLFFFPHRFSHVQLPHPGRAGRFPTTLWLRAAAGAGARPRQPHRRAHRLQRRLRAAGRRRQGNGVCRGPERRRANPAGGPRPGRNFELANAAEISPSDTHWANYLLGVAAQFQQRGVAVPGFDCVFGGTVPMGAGMSSSAAVECGLAFALNQLLDTSLDTHGAGPHCPAGRAHLRRRAVRHHGPVCQPVWARRATWCASTAARWSTSTFPSIPAACRIVLCNSGVKHSLASTGLQHPPPGVRAAAWPCCSSTTPHVHSLRDATLEQLEAHRAELGGDRVPPLRLRGAGKRPRGSRLPPPRSRRPGRLRPGDVRQPRRPARRLRSELRRARCAGGSRPGRCPACSARA